MMLFVVLVQNFTVHIVLIRMIQITIPFLLNCKYYTTVFPPGMSTNYPLHYVNGKSIPILPFKLIFPSSIDWNVMNNEACSDRHH